MDDIDKKHRISWKAELLALDLEEAGWPSVAEDAREGLSPDTILRRLRDIGEGHSDAAKITEEYL